MSAARHLDWPGCFNVRDLGGLPAAGGRITARGAVVRADSLDRLDDQGWQALLDYGIRTVVDLRNDHERGQDTTARPPQLETVNTPLDGAEDIGFWNPIERTPEFGTPLYYRAHLMRKSAHAAAAVAAVARARRGGVLFHCVGGRDRSGELAMLLLALVGVPAAEISADYELSAARLAPMYAAAGREDEGVQLAAYLAGRGTSAAEVIATTLSSLDVEGTLKAGGLTNEDLAALRERMLES
jgi:protein-tyrosine phosphatase